MQSRATSRARRTAGARDQRRGISSSLRCTCSANLRRCACGSVRESPASTARAAANARRMRQRQVPQLVRRDEALRARSSPNSITRTRSTILRSPVRTGWACAPSSGRFDDPCAELLRIHPSIDVLLGAVTPQRCTRAAAFALAARIPSTRIMGHSVALGSAGVASWRRSSSESPDRSRCACCTVPPIRDTISSINASSASRPSFRTATVRSARLSRSDLGQATDRGASSRGPRVRAPTAVRDSLLGRRALATGVCERSLVQDRLVGVACVLGRHHRCPRP